MYCTIAKMRYTEQMVSMILNVTVRTASGSKASRSVRETARIPGVAYGAALEKPVLLSIDDKDFEKVWREAGETSIITLKGLDKDKSALIHDVAVDPIYGKPIHVDFYAVRTDQTVTVDVPLVYIGVAPAEKELGGTLIKVMHDLTIEALPKDLPHELSVDISSLVTFDDQLLVKDLKLPAGVTAVVEQDAVVALVQAVHEEEVTTSAPLDLSSIEVAKKGKVEETPIAE